MKRLVLALAFLAAACGPRRPTQEHQIQETLVRYEIVREGLIAPDAGYPDLHLHIQDWREAVLDHAERLTLLHLRALSVRRIKEFEERGRELMLRPPYVAVDALRDVIDKLALEVERIRLIEWKLATMS